MNGDKLQELRRLAERCLTQTEKHRTSVIVGCAGNASYTAEYYTCANPTTVIELLDEIERLKCCGNCFQYETVCGEGRCFVYAKKPSSRYDKKVVYAEGDGKCDKWEGLK